MNIINGVEYKGNSITVINGNVQAGGSVRHD